MISIRLVKVSINNLILIASETQSTIESVVQSKKVSKSWMHLKPLTSKI